MRFDWDLKKEESHVERPSIDFTMASPVFYDPDAVTEYDAEHSREGEDRWTTIGMVGGNILLIRVRWTDQEGAALVRIISARIAGPHDRELYQKRRSMTKVSKTSDTCEIDSETSCR